jgi:hypothetical protein
MASVELLFADEGLALANLNGLFVNIARRPATMDDLAQVRQLISKHFEKYPQTASIAVLEPNAAQSPSKEFREASAALTRDFKSLAVAIVIEGEGFRAATMRTLAAGLYLINRAGYPHKIVASVDDGTRWLMAKLSPNPFGVTAAELSRAVETTRAAIRSPRPA